MNRFRLKSVLFISIAVLCVTGCASIGPSRGDVISVLPVDIAGGYLFPLTLEKLDGEELAVEEPYKLLLAAGEELHESYVSTGDPQRDSVLYKAAEARLILNYGRYALRKAADTGNTAAVFYLISSRLCLEELNRLTGDYKLVLSSEEEYTEGDGNIINRIENELPVLVDDIEKAVQHQIEIRSGGKS